MITQCECCKGTVSLEATQCPHCGHPGPKEIRDKAERERKSQAEEKKRQAEEALREERKSKGLCPYCGHYWKETKRGPCNGFGFGTETTYCRECGAALSSKTYGGY